MEDHITIEELWQLLEQHQQEVFYTMKKLPFQYTIKGGEMFVDRRSKSITRATFGQALNKLQEKPDAITGPKALNVFGAPYIWAILKTLKLV